MRKVTRNNRIDVLNTVAPYIPRPDLTAKYKKEDKERAKRAARDARLVRILTK